MSNEAVVIVLPDDTVQVVPASEFEGDITVEVELVVNQQEAGAGTGDVVGPNVSVNNNIAVFNGITGKLIKDGGKTIAQMTEEAMTYALIF